MRSRMDFAGGPVPWALLGLVLRQFWVIALVVGVGTLSALAYGRLRPPVFEASAVVQVRQDAPPRAAEDRLMGRDNLLAMVQRHQLFPGQSEDQAAVLLRQAVVVHDLTSEAGAALGFAPEVSGLVISVRLAQAEPAARVANDLAQQILDLGNRGELDADFGDLLFYRGEEERLWQEVAALRAEMEAGTGEGQDVVVGIARRLNLLQDQYDLVRRKLAEAEVAARLESRDRAGRFSLLQRATSATAVPVVGNWMLAGIAGSLLLAVTLAFVLERRYPALQRGPWSDLRARLEGGYRLIDDPARPILGLPRFAVVAAVLVAVLVGVAALAG